MGTGKFNTSDYRQKKLENQKKIFKDFYDFLGVITANIFSGEEQFVSSHYPFFKGNAPSKGVDQCIPINQYKYLVFFVWKCFEELHKNSNTINNLKSVSDKHSDDTNRKSDEEIRKWLRNTSDFNASRMFIVDPKDIIEPYNYSLDENNGDNQLNKVSFEEYFEINKINDIESYKDENIVKIIYKMFSSKLGRNRLLAPLKVFCGSGDTFKINDSRINVLDLLSGGMLAESSFLKLIILMINFKYLISSYDGELVNMSNGDEVLTRLLYVLYGEEFIKILINLDTNLENVVIDKFFDKRSNYKKFYDDIYKLIENGDEEYEVDKKILRESIKFIYNIGENDQLRRIERVLYKITFNYYSLCKNINEIEQDEGLRNVRDYETLIFNQLFSFTALSTELIPQLGSDFESYYLLLFKSLDLVQYMARGNDINEFKRSIET